MRKTLTRILSSVMAAVVISTTCVGRQPVNATTIADEGSGGAYAYDCETGEVKYLPDSSVYSHSDESEGSTPAYSPDTDEEELEDDLQTFAKANWDTVDDPARIDTSRCTVHLKIKTQDGYCAGSGFLIRSNVVVTCGHAVYDKSYDPNNSYWANEIIVTPAANATGNTAPYGTAGVKVYICSTGWINNADENYDWGVLILDSDIGNLTGWHGLHYQSSSYNGTKATAKGYSNGRTQYVTKGTISSTSSKTFASKDMYVQHGMSGGPCYTKIDGYGYLVIGIIINYPSYDPNGIYHEKSVFRKIDKDLYDKLLQFCEEYAP